MSATRIPTRSCRSSTRASSAGGSDGRFWMLETIRELAAERLEQLAGAEDVQRAARALLHRPRAGLGLAMESLSAGHRQRYDLAIPEIDNFRAALVWSEGADPLLGLRLAVRLENLWVTQSLVDGLKHLETPARTSARRAALPTGCCVALPR